MTACSTYRTTCAHSARMALASLPGVSISDCRDPLTGEPYALIAFAGRSAEVLADDDGFAADYFVAGSQTLALVEETTLATAYCAVADLVLRLAGVPAEWSVEVEAVERAAVAAIRAQRRAGSSDAQQLVLPVTMH